MTKKLVRDKIPEIIKKETGKAPIYSVAPSLEVSDWLIKKIIEEAKEAKDAIKSGDPRQIALELADLQTALDALILNQKQSANDIQKLKSKRKKERGGFTKRIIMDFPKNS